MTPTVRGSFTFRTIKKDCDVCESCIDVRCKVDNQAHRLTYVTASYDKNFLRYTRLNRGTCPKKGHFSCIIHPESEGEMAVFGRAARFRRAQEKKFLSYEAHIHVNRCAQLSTSQRTSIQGSKTSQSFFIARNMNDHTVAVFGNPLFKLIFCQHA